jgi:hypothetical protein
MSAFVVGHDHIDALLTFAVDKRVSYWVKETDTRVAITRENVTEVGRILLAENQRSVGYRYHETDPDEMPGTDGEDDSNYYFTRWVEPLSGVALLKGCACFDYQACETDDYESTLAHTIIDAIRHYAIYEVAGWDNAPGWEFRRARVRA